MDILGVGRIFGLYFPSVVPYFSYSWVPPFFFFFSNFRSTVFSGRCRGLETALYTAGPYAMDNVLWTNWTADCMVQLGGCAAKTQGVGIDIAFTEAYATAVAEKESVWSVTWTWWKASFLKFISFT